MRSEARAPEEVGRGIPFPIAAKQRLSEARTLLEIASDLAPGVLAGKPLAPRKSAAYTGSGFR